MSARRLLWPLCIALFTLTACGGGNAAKPAVHTAPPVMQLVAKLAPAPTAPGLARELPALPADQRLNPLRMTAAVDATQPGDHFTSSSSGLIVSAGAAELHSSVNHVSWAVYTFGGTPGEDITNCAYTVSGLDPGETVYCAISDYQAQRWSFLPLASTATATFTLPNPVAGHYQSALGNTWLLVATFGGDQVDLQSVSVTYANRHKVTGQIVDKGGVGVAGVKVGLTFAGLSATTDASGNYTLPGVADGTWAVLATRDGWAFYTQPEFVTVAAADAVAPTIIGDPHGSRFAAKDTLPGNDQLRTAPLFDLEAGPLSESLSGDDDAVDNYRFTVTTPGSYLLRFANPDQNILAPIITLYSGDYQVLASSASIYTGNAGVSFTVTQAPQDFVFQVYTLAGGGAYSLTLLHQTGCIFGGTITNGPPSVGSGLFTVTHAADGSTTQYFMNSVLTASSAYAAFDDAMPAGAAVVTAALPGYALTPAAVPITFTPGPLQLAAFTGTPPAVADSYEPNDSAATAAPLALPFTSSVPLQVSGVNSGDSADYYKFTPAAGHAILAVIGAPTPFAPYPALTGQLYDSALNPVGTSSATSAATLIYSDELADGNPYYLEVQTRTAANQVVGYTLNIQDYAGAKFQAAARVTAGGQLLGGARFVIYTADFQRIFTLYAQDDGLTPPIFIAPGSGVRVDCYRYGMAMDGTTRQLTMPAADTTAYFDAPDQGQDSLEPNNSAAVPLTAVTLPATISATLDVESDPWDHYQLDPGDGRPFKVSLSTDNATSYVLYLLDHSGGFAGVVTLHGPSDVVYFPNEGVAGQKLAIRLLNFFSGKYQLTVANADAYHISGQVQNTIATGLAGIVAVDGTAKSTTSSGFGGGGYEFEELFPPGDYTLDAFVSGFAPALNQQNVTITNADVTVNFMNFTPASQDNYEPNNSAATAYPLALNTAYSASVDGVGGSDSADYYSVAVGAGDQLRFQLTTSEPWDEAELQLSNLYTSDVWTAYTTTPGTQVIDFTSTAAQVCHFVVTGTANYTLEVFKVN